jgi:anti-anti-sigma regulatory factor
MVLKIERSSDGGRLVLRLSGRIQSEYLEELKPEMQGSPHIVLDLEDVKLVDVDVVRFLESCEANGAELRHCSRYIREWILKEKSSRAENEEQ